VSLLFAIPDHPWVDDGAAVRIAMTVLAPGDTPGLLQTVVAEHDEGTDGYSVELQSKTGKIGSDLNVGADTSACGPLTANANLSAKGFEPGVGKGQAIHQCELERNNNGYTGLSEHHAAVTSLTTGSPPSWHIKHLAMIEWGARLRRAVAW